MEKTDHLDRLATLKSSANNVNFEADIVSRHPPAIQLKSEKQVGPEIEEKNVPHEPYQLTSVDATPPIDSPAANGGNSNSGPPSNSESFKPNNNGLPTQLKSGVENLSGFSMDDVQVHYNSDKPAQLQAHAYAQGTDIHLASGQEKHLPHEAWHVVQQKQGRVQPTTQLKAFNINDDAGLEKEADEMGEKAMQRAAFKTNHPAKMQSGNASTVQLFPFWNKKKKKQEIGSPTLISTTNNQATVPIEQPKELTFKEEIAAFQPEKGDPTVKGAEMMQSGYGLVTSTTGGTDPAPKYKDSSDGFKYAANGENARTKSDGEKSAAAFGVGMSLTTPVFGFYLAIKKLGSDDIDKQIAGGFELFSSAAQGVKAGADVAKTINSKDSAAIATSAIAGSVSDGITALKTGVLTIRDIYKAYKEATSDIGSSNSDKVDAGLNVVKNLISTAASTVSALKTILDLFERGSAGMANAIPGLGIALSAVQIAIDVYAIIKAKTSESFINSELGKNQWQGTLGKGKKKRGQQDNNTEIFREEIAKYDKKIASLNEARTNLVSNNKQNQLPKLDDKIKGLKENRELAIESLASLEENTALTNLKQINVDRTANAGFDIGVEITKIIGNVLSLVPEPNTQAASVALKAAASGASLFKKGGEIIRQSARDYADANPTSKLNSIVDTTRSSANELARKKASVNHIFMVIQDADIEDESEFTKISNYIEATGISLQTLCRDFESGGLKKAVASLIKAQ